MVLRALGSSRAIYGAALGVDSKGITGAWAGAHGNLAGVYEWQGLHDEALACHRRAMDLAPDAPGIHGNYLFTLLFHPGYDARALRREHAEWNRRHAAASDGVIATHDNDRTPGRRLRVGYVGGFFAITWWEEPCCRCCVTRSRGRRGVLLFEQSDRRLRDRAFSANGCRLARHRTDVG